MLWLPTRANSRRIPLKVHARPRLGSSAPAIASMATGDWPSTSRRTEHGLVFPGVPHGCWRMLVCPVHIGCDLGFCGGRGRIRTCDPLLVRAVDAYTAQGKNAVTSTDMFVKVRQNKA